MYSQLLCTIIVSPLKCYPFCNEIGGLIREVTSLEGDNLVVFYYLKASDIWLHKRNGLWWEWPNKREATVFTISKHLISGMRSTS